MSGTPMSDQCLCLKRVMEDPGEVTTADIPHRSRMDVRDCEENILLFIAGEEE